MCEELKITCPICKKQGEISIVITEEQNLMFEYIPSYKYAEFNCPHCQTRLFDKFYSRGEDNEKILREFEDRLKNINLKDSETIGRYFLTKYQLSMKKNPENWMKEIDKIIDRLKTREILNNEGD